MEKTYSIPEQVVDTQEEQLLVSLTETYEKMVAPTKATKTLKTIGEKIPTPVKDAFGVASGVVFMSLGWYNKVVNLVMLL